MKQEKTKKRKVEIRWYVHTVSTVAKEKIIPISWEAVHDSCYWGGHNRFFTAPNLKAIHLVTKGVKGGCVKDSSAKKIMTRTGQWCRFKIGDPIEFRGKVMGEVMIGDYGYIKIMVSRKYQVYFYCKFNCSFVELVS